MLTRWQVDFRKVTPVCSSKYKGTVFHQMKPTNRRPRLTQAPKAKLKIRQVYVAAAFATLLIAGSVFVAINFTGSTQTMAAVTGDFRTISSGDWADKTIWERFDGTSWLAATSSPKSSDGTITVQNGHTVSVMSNLTVDQVIIDNGGRVNVSSGTLTVNNGSGTDLTVNGTFETIARTTFTSSVTSTVNGTEILSSTGTLAMGTNAVRTIGATGIFRRDGGTMPSSLSALTINGTYRHNTDGSVVPDATWNAGSTCEISGVTANCPSNLDQSFRNFKWNSAAQTASLNLNGALISVSENFNLSSTGTGNIILDYQGNSVILNIGGNMLVEGGEMYGCVNGSTSINVTGNYIQTGGLLSMSKAGGTAYGNSSSVVTITGDVTMTGGTLDMSRYDGNNPGKGVGFFIAKGDLNVLGSAILTCGSAVSRGKIQFNGTGLQNYSAGATNITGKVDFIVNSGSILNLGLQSVISDGTFTMDDGSGIVVGDPDGITTSGNTGNIRVTGTRTFSTAADYTYSGSTAQATGNALPSTVRNLIFSNANPVTLTSSTIVSGQLTMDGGMILANSNILTLGTSHLNTGTLVRNSGYVVGSFRRWIAAVTAANVLFPIGTLEAYTGANFTFIIAPVAGTLTASMILTTTGKTGLPLMDAGDECVNAAWGFWQVTAGNGFSGGVYNVNLYANGYDEITDYTKLHLLRRNSITAPWEANGTHLPGTGSNTAPVLNRSGMTSVGQFGLISPAVNALPVQLIFFKAVRTDAKVNLTWATASEENNDFFTVERSGDGRNFSTILTQKGAGNSHTRIDYKDVDQQPLSGTVYYRLKQTDFDGKFTYSNLVTVKDGKTSESANAFRLQSLGPNPFTDQFNMRFDAEADGEAEVILYNLAGQSVYRERIKVNSGINNFEFTDQENLPAGTYILNVICENSKLSQKLIKK